MILLDNVIQIFTLTNLDAFSFVFVVLLDRCGIGAAFINVDQARFSISANGSIEKAQRGLLVSPGCE